jgi:hypothetical protein
MISDKKKNLELLVVFHNYVIAALSVKQPENNTFLMHLDISS